MKTQLKLIFPAIIFAGNIFAQVFSQEEVAAGGNLGFDDNMQKVDNASKGKLYPDQQSGFHRKIEYDYLRQANVTWEKRIWRTIDAREKLNQTLMYPLSEVDNRISLIDLIKKGIRTGAITIFDSDQFKNTISKEQALANFFTKKVIKQYNENGDPIADTTILEEIPSDKITSFELKEDWYFEKERGVMEVRILGICPVYYDEEKQASIEKGWIYFPQARDLFAQRYVFNPKTNVGTVSYDDFFQKRMFNSYITKESNTFDRGIGEYMKGIDALVESDRIKNGLFQWEHDLWHF